ncbi:MAG: hypothetical protein JXR86_18140 [Spirochaetales bacterium]|nr:hypothetical protein [Spirochaetales bacterium]
MKNNTLKYRLTLLITFMVLPLLPAESWYSYNYSYWEKPVPAPEAYRHSEILRGEDFGAGAFREPEDLFISPDGDMYIADGGNNRIVVLSPTRETRIIDSFTNKGVRDNFNRPEGLFVDSRGILYVADTLNRRVVALNADFESLNIITRPDSDILREEYEFFPSKVGVDKAGRLYVLGPGMYEGMMEFDRSGRFHGFIGSNRVTFNLWKYLMRTIATKEQREKMQIFIPQEYRNLDIDGRGFLYTTTRDEDQKTPIKKHNAEGLDILTREGFFPPSGDISVSYSETASYVGKSFFADIAVDDSGDIYYALDSKRGRVFTYNSEGQLLFLFGGAGEPDGCFTDASAVDLYGNEVYVLDKVKGSITVFSPTEYGNLILEAQQSQSRGEYRRAEELWTTILRRNSNYDPAYTGIGKSLLRSGSFREAMDNFRMGYNKKSFSKAYKYYRQEVMKDHFSLIVLFIAAAAVGLILILRLRDRNREKRKRKFLGPEPSQGERILYGFRILAHPFDGHYDLKFRAIGTWGSAAAWTALIIFSITFNMQMTSFLFNEVNTVTVKLQFEVAKVLIALFVFVLANWTVTSIMGGEGSFRSIFISTAYSGIPIVLVFVPMALLSNFLILEEGAYYYVMESIAVMYSLFLLIAGNMTIHNYSLWKTVSTLVLTVVTIAIMAFLALLFITFIGQVWSFVSAIYKEVIFRI